MENILNITNGDSAVKVMREAGIAGVLLPWRDVLHDGPVPSGLSLEKLSEVRAQFIIEQGWGEPETIRQDFIERDNALKSFRDYTKVILWFEHDLYDQLQILQILAWFFDNATENAALSIICTDQYLGMASPDQINSLLKFEEQITNQHLLLAKKAWSAFRSASPTDWQDLLNQDTSILPFLEGAVIRLLEEYPDCYNGLSRTAQKALEVIANGEQRPGRVFGQYQETEERRFLGDSSFWVILQQMLESNPPLIVLPPGKWLTLPTCTDQALSITQAGREVLQGDRHWLDLTSLNRWIGGVHLTHENLWCWDPDSNSMQGACKNQ